METMTAALSVSGSGSTVSQSTTTTTDGATRISATIPANSVDLEIDVGSIPRADMASLFMLAQFASSDLANATSPVSIHINAPGAGSGTPDDDFDLNPNKFGYWDDQSPFDNPIDSGATEINTLYVDNPNSVPCTLIFRTNQDVTP